MRLYCFFVLSILHSSFALAKNDKQKGGSVVILDTQNFDQVISSNQYVLVRFYSPSCNYCNSLAPAYSKAAQELAAVGSSIKLAEINLAEEQYISNRYRLSEQEPLKLFKNGVLLDYTGGTTSESIVQWLLEIAKQENNNVEKEATVKKHRKKKKQSKEVIVLSHRNFNKIIDSNEYVLVKFYAPWCTHCKNLAPEYVKAAEKLATQGSLIKLAEINAEEERGISKRYDISGYPTLKLFKDGKPLDYTGGRMAESIVQWLLEKVKEEESIVHKEAEVIVLNNDNFTKFIESNQYVLVKFYDHECVHCQKLAPEYSKAAQKLADEGSSIRFAKLDASQEEYFDWKYNITGYPTLMLFKNFTTESPIEYKSGGRSRMIVDWLKKNTGRTATSLKNTNKAKSFIKDNEIVIIGFFKDQSSEKAKRFLSVAADFQNYKFGITSEDEILLGLNIHNETIVLFHKLDDRRTEFDDNYTEEAIRAFINRESLPLVFDLSQADANIFTGGHQYHFVIFVSKISEQYNQAHQAAKQLATEFRRQVMFLIYDTEEDNFLATLFGAKRSEYPTMRLVRINLPQITRYKPQKFSLALETMRAFIQSVLDNKLQPFLMSEDIPQDWNTKALKTLVAKTFNEVVFDADKTVLVLFYSPSHPLSTMTIPVFEQLAEKYKNKSSIVIAKIDILANQLESIPTDSFLSIKLFKEGDKKTVNYKGTGTVEDLSKFIKKHRKYLFYGKDEL
ncbi:protein disulfide-isomerase 2-like [Artemia franciscana]|uniref:protein disulfide-isomerase 2-like n=1 Tax=Artemia franciscana TaxID=6661 RepID=UPI0032DAEFD4